MTLKRLSSTSTFFEDGIIKKNYSGTRLWVLREPLYILY